MMAFAQASASVHALRPAAIGTDARFLPVIHAKTVESAGAALAIAGCAVASSPVMEQGIARSTQCTECARATDPAADSASHDAVGGRSAVEGDASQNRTRLVGDLYTAHYHRVFGFARRLVDEESAEEIAHESFVRLLRVRNLETMTISVAYLLRIAENLIRRRHGRSERHRAVIELFGRMVPGFDSLGESRGHGESEWLDSDRLRSVLHRLTPSEQSAVRLIVCEGLDYQAAARSLGVPVSTINNWKHRALTKLKQIIEQASDRGERRVLGRLRADRPSSEVRFTSGVGFPTHASEAC